MYMIELHFNDGHYTEFLVSEARLNKFKEWMISDSVTPFHIIEEDADYYILKNNIKYVKIYKYEETEP